MQSDASTSVYIYHAFIAVRRHGGTLLLSLWDPGQLKLHTDILKNNHLLLQHLLSCSCTVLLLPSVCHDSCQCRDQQAPLRSRVYEGQKSASPLDEPPAASVVGI